MALNEGIRPGEFLLSEGNGTISREEVLIDASAAAMPAGTLLGKVTATGRWKAYDNSASDGTEVARGILYAAVPDSTTHQKAVAIVRMAEVIGALLTGLDTPGREDLLALNIIVR